VEKAEKVPVNPLITKVQDGRGIILLVEDEPSILEMTTLMLEQFGYTVFPVATPGEALKQADLCHGKIDLLMTDVIMPEMNGNELAQKLQIQYPNMKQLFMSGYTADVISHQGVLDSSVHFIQKPFTVQDLCVQVREVLLSNSNQGETERKL
jgi:CheY-like chemotaxis protein